MDQTLPHPLHGPADAGIAADPAPLPRPRRKLRWAVRLIAVFLALLWIAILWLAVTAPLSKSLKPIAPPSMTLLAKDGQVIARRGATIGRPVNVARLPAHLGNAFVAIEDRRFYRHWGIDPRGITRAMWRNLRAGGLREGGSTITQQLAKLVFLTSNRTFGRKAREVLVAFWLEAWLTKQEILSRYLSTVYFGDNVYGLTAAARHYFDKTPEQLTIAESALLAGLMKAPSRLAPTGNLAGAQARQRLVVAAMAENGLITAEQARRARPPRLRVVPIKAQTRSTYFADWVMPAARASHDGDLYGAQEVTTTLDARLQRLAERSVARAGHAGAQIGLVAMRPDGSVVAMVGGRDYKTSSFNRATQARRQPGSTFKLFVYLAALREGLDPDDMVDDTPLTVGGYRPANSAGRYRGRITLRQAFAQSSNVAAVRLAQQVGMNKVVRAARDLGVRSALRNDPSLALGTSGMTLLELCAAYAAVAAGAYPVNPVGLPQTPKGWFQSWWDGPNRLGGDIQDDMLDLLGAVVEGGTGGAAALSRDTFGKTGTSQDNRDAIFVGFSGGLVTAVWVGRDDNKPVPGLAGGGLPARVWRNFMAEATGAPPARKPVPELVDPDAAATAIVNQVTDLVNTAIDQVEGIDLKVGVGPDGLTIDARPDEQRLPEEQPAE